MQGAIVTNPPRRLLEVARIVALASCIAGIVVATMVLLLHGSGWAWGLLLLVPGVLVLVGGQLLAIWQLVSQRSGGASGARAGSSVHRTTLAEVFGPSRPFRTWMFALLVMVWAVAFVLLAVSRSGSAASQELAERIMPLVFTFFFGGHALVFDGALIGRSSALEG